jgi:hypothetical protein
LFGKPEFIGELSVAGMISSGTVARNNGLNEENVAVVPSIVVIGEDAHQKQELLHKVEVQVERTLSE